MHKRIFIDQVFSGFSLSLADYGVQAFVNERQELINNPDIEYILEFCEINVDTYEQVVRHQAGKRDNTFRMIAFWDNERYPSSIHYWNQDEFRALTDALHAAGIARIMVRTFFTFSPRTGSGRFLRDLNHRLSDHFDWRRADEFCLRHPEVRDEKSGLLQWHNTLRADPLYDIEENIKVGDWFLRQLISLYKDLGIDAVRFGDGSFGGELQYAMQNSAKEFTELNMKVREACEKAGIRHISSLGPYWTHDHWHNTLGINYDDCDRVADALIVQPLEGWTDRYGIMHVHNGEYFNAGVGLINALINKARSPKAQFIRGLDSGDAIENWFPPIAMAIRQNFDSSTCWAITEEGPQPCYEGVYHFWSDHLTKDYYQKQQALELICKQHPAKNVAGPRLVSTIGQKPGAYVLGDLFCSCGYGLRAAVDSQHIDAKHPHVYFLPRRPDAAALINEDAHTAEDDAGYAALLADPKSCLIVVGGACDAAFLDAFGLSLENEIIKPTQWASADQSGAWQDHAADSAHKTMAGKAEDHMRHDYLRFSNKDADILCEAIDAAGQKRVIISRKQTTAGGWRIFINAPTEDAIRAVADQAIAEPCALDWRVNADAEISSGSWSDAKDNTFLQISRYDAWHKDPVDCSIDWRDYEIVFSSAATESQTGLFSLEPQASLLLRAK